MGSLPDYQAMDKALRDPEDYITISSDDEDEKPSKRQCVNHNDEGGRPSEPQRVLPPVEPVSPLCESTKLGSPPGPLGKSPNYFPTSPSFPPPSLEQLRGQTPPTPEPSTLSSDELRRKNEQSAVLQNIGKFVRRMQLAIADLIQQKDMFFNYVTIGTVAAIQDTWQSLFNILQDTQLVFDEFQQALVNNKDSLLRIALRNSSNKRAHKSFNKKYQKVHHRLSRSVDYSFHQTMNTKYSEYNSKLREMTTTDGFLADHDKQKIREIFYHVEGSILSLSEDFNELANHMREFVVHDM